MTETNEPWRILQVLGDAWITWNAASVKKRLSAFERTLAIETILKGPHTVFRDLVSSLIERADSAEKRYQMAASKKGCIVNISNSQIALGHSEISNMNGSATRLLRALDTDPEGRTMWPLDLTCSSPKG